MSRAPGTIHPPSRIDGIDCLRALAIFYVLLNHTALRLIFSGIAIQKSLPRQLSSALFWQGQAGVQIFFAVSGFLITSMTIARWNSPKNFRIREFYLIRFARIAPLLLALIAVLSLLHALQLKHFVVSAEQGGLANAIFAVLTLRVGLLEATRGYLPANWDILWSLSVEEMFYLFFPLLYRFLGRSKWLVFTLCAFIALGPFARTVFTAGNPVWREYSYLGGMDAIALGCLTALFIAGRTLSRRTILTLTLCGAALLIFCLVFAPQMAALGLEKSGLGMTLLAIGTCMLITAAAQSKWKTPPLFNPLLSYGHHSYEIYLTHMFLVFACFGFFTYIGKPPYLILPYFLTAMILSGLLGWLVAKFFSEPANHWLRIRFGAAPGSYS